MMLTSSTGPLEEVADVFKGGGVIAYPTETFYALGVDPFNAQAVERLFKLKGRPETKPITLIIRDVEMLGSVVAEVTETAAALVKRFWPGPLTIVFKANKDLPSLVTANTGTVGVRVSSNPACQRLLDAIKSPITATSANPSGAKPSRTVEEVIGFFNGSIDAIIDGGALKGIKGSTIVDATGPQIALIREGEIPYRVIQGR